MDSTLLAQLYQELDDLRAQGKEDAARQLLLERLQTMPDALQDELTLRLVDAAVARRGDELAAVRSFQQAGLEALQALEKEDAS